MLLSDISLKELKEAWLRCFLKRNFIVTCIAGVKQKTGTR
jgi:hypothetical protein